MLQFHNPEVYVPEGCKFHRRCSLLLQCDLLHVQLPGMHKSVLLHRIQQRVLPHRLQELRFSARRCPLSGWSDVRKYFLHLLIRNGQLHAGCCGIHKKMSDKSVLLLHLSPDPPVPVLREAALFQISMLSLNMSFCSYGNPHFLCSFSLDKLCLFSYRFTMIIKMYLSYIHIPTLSIGIWIFFHFFFETVLSTHFFRT